MTHRCALGALKIFADPPCGYVRAARSCAATLLADVKTVGADLAGVRLLVTAALLHFQCETGAPRLTPRGLSAILKSLSKDGAAPRAVAPRSSLLVQYVAAETQEGELSADSPLALTQHSAVR